MSTPADQFEARLEAMFADPPQAPDAEAFALAVEQRMLVEGRRRGLVLGACTAAAGLASAAIFAFSKAAGDATQALSTAAGAVARVDLTWLPQLAPLAGMIIVVLIFTEIAPTARRR